MDGNGRWASARARPPARATAPAPRTSAASSGASASSASSYLTLYAFSTENWRGRATKSAASAPHPGRGHRPRANEAAPARRAARAPRQPRRACDRLRSTGPRRHRPDPGQHAHRPSASPSTTAAATRSSMPCSASSPTALRAEPSTKRPLSQLPVHRRHARPRPDHPHGRRDAALQLPDLAGRLRRVLLHADPLARLRRGRHRGRPQAYADPHPQVRRRNGPNKGSSKAGPDGRHRVLREEPRASLQRSRMSRGRHDEIVSPATSSARSSILPKRDTICPCPASCPIGHNAP